MFRVEVAAQMDEKLGRIYDLGMNKSVNPSGGLRQGETTFLGQLECIFNWKIATFEIIIKSGLAGRMNHIR